MDIRVRAERFVQEHGGKTLRVLFTTQRGEPRDYTGVITVDRPSPFIENALVSLYVEGQGSKSFRIDRLKAFNVIEGAKL